MTIVTTSTPNRKAALIPVLFVFLWSTGFIGAKYALPYIEPFYLLFIRMSLTVVVFMGLMWWFKAPKLSINQLKHQVVSGLLIHGAYLGGVFAAIKWQMPAGITALLVSLQPLLTALLLIKKASISLRQWIGLLLGFMGVAIVLYSRGALPDFTLTWPMLAAVLVSLLGITLGSLYQKRFSSHVNLLSASTVQYAATAILMALLTFTFEQQQVNWQWPLIASLIWLVFGLSVTAILLLLHMIKQGASEKVASYFYLVPGVTAIQAWLLFDEQLPILAIGGLLLSLIGVYLTVRSPKSAR
jgi:drug/metabolite transporter (DMT)-like permease